MPNLIPAILLGAVLETLLFGAYLVVFATSCLTFFTSRRRGWLKGSLNKGILTADLAMFLSINAHWALGIARLFEAFVDDRTTALEYFQLISERKRVAKVALYAFQCLIADMIMVLRLYYVSSKSLTICVLPILTTSGLAVAGSGLVWQSATAQPYRDPFTSGQWVWSCFTLTLSTTMYSTLVIAYKLWSSYKTLKNMNVNLFVDSPVPHVIQIIVESAALYSTCTFVSFVLFLARSNAHFAVLDLTSPIVGLVLCLIVVRGRIPGHCPLNPSTGSVITLGDTMPRSRNRNQTQTLPPSLVVSIDETRIIHHDSTLVSPTNKTEREEDVESTAEGHGVEAC
ncbi:hypothetical protein BDN71DRAFT_1444485 [Pleurotus eryngii]|uniref:Uncharacterized protein n=1 Tax=Pleurotus eryngii TaxID=5323 RepID=A0A9P6A2J2_PLEER|nr:hypothetical protein BDN71DRAFT_1444485 [Pleurotus eryngii]